MCLWTCSSNVFLARISPLVLLHLAVGLTENPMLGLSVIDWLVVATYVGGITIVGLYANRRVHLVGDYFMGGRRFGRFMMTAQA